MFSLINGFLLLEFFGSENLRLLDWTFDPCVLLSLEALFGWSAASVFLLCHPNLLHSCLLLPVELSFTHVVRFALIHILRISFLLILKLILDHLQLIVKVFIQCFVD